MKIPVALLLLPYSKPGPSEQRKHPNPVLHAAADLAGGI